MLLPAPWRLGYVCVRCSAAAQAINPRLTRNKGSPFVFSLRSLCKAFMRIAQVAPLAESVPPKFYGGTERVVAWLVDELVELGHEVTLFASGDSRTRGTLHPVWPHALRLGRPRTDPLAALAVSLEAVSTRAKEFDVIHAHIDWL